MYVVSLCRKVINTLVHVFYPTESSHYEGYLISCCHTEFSQLFDHLHDVLEVLV